MVLRRLYDGHAGAGRREAEHGRDGDRNEDEFSDRSKGSVDHHLSLRNWPSDSVLCPKDMTQYGESPRSQTFGQKSCLLGFGAVDGRGKSLLEALFSYCSAFDRTDSIPD